MKIALIYFNTEKISISRGPGYIASVVLDTGYDLTFFDMAYHSLEELPSQLVAEKYDLLLFSASTLYYLHAVNFASAVKRLSDIPILLGGMHATILKGEILKSCPDIDYICVGEGEGFVLEFLDVIDKGKDFTSIANLGYRTSTGCVAINLVRPCTDLGTLPQFRFDLFHPESITNKFPRPGFCYVYATRGCPYRCSYCCNTINLDLYPKKYLRTRGIDEIIDELLYLKSHYPVKLFYFGDEMILFNKTFVTELFHRIKSEVQVPIGCMFRTECVDSDIVDLFRETNCRYVGMGIECGDEKFRKKFLNRQMTNEQIIKSFAMLRKIKGMVITSYNMRGYPVPYDADLTKSTKSLNAIVKPDIFQSSIFYPFPGTKLYQYCIDHDLIDFDKVKQMEKVHQCYFRMSVLKGVVV